MERSSSTPDTRVEGHPVGIRRFSPADADDVIELFELVNRQLAPPRLRERFEAYIASSIEEEIGRVAAYYGERGGSFWVARLGGDGRLAGMYGLETTGPGRMELRRMYVAPDLRGQGIARKMLAHAEDRCRADGAESLELSTSELQPAALSLYRRAGYAEQAERTVTEASNKTIGGGVRRYYFEKRIPSSG